MVQMEFLAYWLIPSASFGTDRHLIQLNVGPQ